MKLWARAGVSLNIFLFFTFNIFFLRTGGYRSLPSFQVAIRFRVGRYRRRPAEFVKRSRRENDGQAHSDRFFVLFCFVFLFWRLGFVSFGHFFFVRFGSLVGSASFFISLSLSLSLYLSLREPTFTFIHPSSTDSVLDHDPTGGNSRYLEKETT